MATSTATRGRVTLRSRIKEEFTIDTSSLQGWANGKPIKVLNILTNTAVCYPKDGSGQKFLESLEDVFVKKSDIKYIAAKPLKHPPRKPANK